MSTIIKKVPTGRTINWEATAPGYLSDSGSFVMPDSPYILNIKLEGGFIIVGVSNVCPVFYINDVQVTPTWNPTTGKFLYSVLDKSQVYSVKAMSRNTQADIEWIRVMGTEYITDFSRMFQYLVNADTYISVEEESFPDTRSGVRVDYSHMFSLGYIFDLVYHGDVYPDIIFDGCEIGQSFTRDDIAETPFIYFKSKTADDRYTLPSDFNADDTYLNVYARGCSSESVEKLKTWFWGFIYNDWGTSPATEHSYAIGSCGKEVRIWISDNQYWSGILENFPNVVPQPPYAPGIWVAYKYNWTLVTVNSNS